jgi:iron(III) transport system permease protein
MARPSRIPAALAVPAAAAVFVGLAPLIYLFDAGFSRGIQGVIDEIVRSRTLWLVVRSLTLTLVVTLACVIIGTVCAWIVVRTSLRGRVVLLTLFALPLAIPSYLAAFAWVSWLPDIAGFFGAALVLTIVSYPYVMLPVAAALRASDIALEDVARSLGISPLTAAWRVSLRQVQPAIVGGGLLVALYVVSDFGAVAAMRYETFTWVIFGAYRAGFNPTRAAILALVLVVIAAVLIALERRVRGRTARTRLGRGLNRRSVQVSPRSLRIAALAWSGIVIAVSVGVPIVSVATWMRRGTAVTDWSDVALTIRDSFGIGIATALATVLLALPVGIAIARFSGRFTRATEASVYLTHSLPGIVVALAVVYLGINLVRPLYQEVPLLVFGQMIIFLPLVVGAVRNAVEQSTPVLEDVARSLGTSRMATLRRVTIPVALPGIAAGGALALLGAVKELPTTLLVRPTGLETLSTSIWKHSVVSDYGAVGPYAVALMLLAAAPTAVLSTFSVMKTVRQ